jgi:hypothetical protein
MLGEWLKIAIPVQQPVPVLDAPRRDCRIECLSNGHPTRRAAIGNFSRLESLQSSRLGNFHAPAHQGQRINPRSDRHGDGTHHYAKQPGGDVRSIA